MGYLKEIGRNPKEQRRQDLGESIKSATTVTQLKKVVETLYEYIKHLENDVALLKSKIK